MKYFLLYSTNNEGGIATCLAEWLAWDLRATCLIAYRFGRDEDNNVRLVKHSMIIIVFGVSLSVSLINVRWLVLLDNNPDIYLVTFKPKAGELNWKAIKVHTSPNWMKKC